MTEWGEVPVWYRGSIVAAALVDLDDVDWLMQWKWVTAYRHRMTDVWGPATRSTRRGGWAMHRQILGLGFGDKRIGHHINQDQLDNRRCNLKVCADRMAHAQEPHPRLIPQRVRPRGDFPKGVVWTPEAFEERAA